MLDGHMAFECVKDTLGVEMDKETCELHGKKWRQRTVYNLDHFFPWAFFSMGYSHPFSNNGHT